MSTEHINLWHTGAELDDIAFRLEISTRLVLIAHTAFIDGQNKPDKRDFDALYSVFLQQDDIVKEVREISEQLQTIRTATAEQDGAADVLRSLHEAYQAGHEGKPPKHTPTLTGAEPDTMGFYSEAMTAMYQWGKYKAEFTT